MMMALDFYPLAATKVAAIKCLQVSWRRIQFSHAQVSCRKSTTRYRVLGPEGLARELGNRPATVHTHLWRQRWDKIPQPSVRLATGPIWYPGDVNECRTMRRNGNEA